MKEGFKMKRFPIILMTIGLMFLFVATTSAKENLSLLNADSNYAEMTFPPNNDRTKVLVGAATKYYVSKDSIKTISEEDGTKTIKADVIGIIVPMVSPKYQSVSYYKINLILSYDKDGKMTKALPAFYQCDVNGNIKNTESGPALSSSKSRLRYDLFEMKMIDSISEFVWNNSSK